MSAVRGRDRGTQAPIRAQRGAQSCWGRCELGLGVYESWQNQIVGLERDGSSSVAPKVWIIGHCVWFNLTHALGYQSQSSLNLNLQYGEAADGAAQQTGCQNRSSGNGPHALGGSGCLEKTASGAGSCCRPSGSDRGQEEGGDRGGRRRSRCGNVCVRKVSSTRERREEEERDVGGWLDGWMKGWRENGRWMDG